MARMQIRTGALGAFLFAVVAACGGGDDAAPVSTAPVIDESAAATTATPVASSTAPSTAPTVASTAPPPPTVATLPEGLPWDGPRFDAAIEPTMAALSSGFAQPFDAAVVGPEIAVPVPTPVPAPAVVTGAGWVSEYESFDGSYDLTFAVGLDPSAGGATLTPEALEAWSAAPGVPGWTSPSFAESGSLFTSLLIDAADQRLVYVLDTDAASSGRPVLNLEWSPATDALREPDWLASLPRPDGGVPTEISVGRGLVLVGFASGFDGNVFVRFDYAPTELQTMIDYFEQGVLVGAGFDYEPSPLSNTSYRRDVVIGDWSGEVSIGEVTSGDEVTALQVIWSLTRV